jgi:F-type H+-transporting ATPase subunit epsilon
MTMDLEILVPAGIVARATIEALEAADSSGRFGLWPNHERFFTVLVPCVLAYREQRGRPSFAAVDGGVLLSEQNRISVVTRDAVVAPRLEEVADAAAAMLRTRREQELSARAAFAELEASLLRELHRSELRP